MRPRARGCCCSRGCHGTGACGGIATLRGANTWKSCFHCANFLQRQIQGPIVHRDACFAQLAPVLLQEMLGACQAFHIEQVRSRRSTEDFRDHRMRIHRMKTSEIITLGLIRGFVRYL